MLRFRMFKTYFFKILMLFTLGIITIITLLSWFLNTHFERYVLRMVNTLNQESLAESHRINNYLQKVVKISGMELFLEPSIQKLMYQENIKNFDVVIGIRRLDAVMSANLYIHSIYVYNAKNQYIYTTSNVFSDTPNSFEDQEVLELLNGNSDHRRLAPIPRFIQGSTKDLPVFSFVFYDIQNIEPRIQGALVINFTLEWLRDIFRDTEDSKSQIAFIDMDGTVVYHSDPTNYLENISGQEIFIYMVENKQPNGYFLHRQGKEKSFVFFSKSEDSPLFLIRIYPYDVIMSGILNMRTTTLLLVLGCVSIALVLGFMISRRLYKPIHQLVSRVDKENEAAIYDQGEIGFLSSSIDNMLAQAEIYMETTESYKKLLQIDVLQEILMGKFDDPELVEQQFKEYGFPFSLDLPFQLFALKPCNEQIFQAFGNLQDVVTLLGVPLSGNRMLVLTQKCLGLGANRFYETAFAQGVELIVACQGIEHPSHLSTKTSLILEELKFSFLYKTPIVINEGSLGRKVHAGPYPTDIERNILQFLRQGHSQEAYWLYQDFFDQVSTYSFTHFRFSLKRLYISMQLLVKEMKVNGSFIDYHEMGISAFESFIDGITQRSTLDDLILGWFEGFATEVQRGRALKNKAIADQIKLVVDKEYSNPNLCLQYLADKVELSVSYVSKLFKECEGISLSDYYFEKRIREAVQRLVETDIPIKDIASSIGFANENYFYTVFKKRFDMTPNEYRNHKRL